MSSSPLPSLARLLPRRFAVYGEAGAVSEFMAGAWQTRVTLLPRFLLSRYEKETMRSDAWPLLGALVELSGSLAFGFNRPGGAEANELVVRLDWLDPEKAVAFFAPLRRGEKPAAVEEIGGCPASIFADGFVHLLDEGVAWIFSSRALAEEILARRDGRAADSLAEDAGFRADQAGNRATKDSFFLRVDLDRIPPLLPLLAEKDRRFLLERLGVQSLAAATVTLRFTEGSATSRLTARARSTPVDLREWGAGPAVAEENLWEPAAFASLLGMQPERFAAAGLPAGICFGMELSASLVAWLAGLLPAESAESGARLLAALKENPGAIRLALGRTAAGLGLGLEGTPALAAAGVGLGNDPTRYSALTGRHDHEIDVSSPEQPGIIHLTRSAARLGLGLTPAAAAAAFDNQWAVPARPAPSTESIHAAFDSGFCRTTADFASLPGLIAEIGTHAAFFNHPAFQAGAEAARQAIAPGEGTPGRGRPPAGFPGLVAGLAPIVDWGLDRVTRENQMLILESRSALGVSPLFLAFGIGLSDFIARNLPAQESVGKAGPVAPSAPTPSSAPEVTPEENESLRRFHEHGLELPDAERPDHYRRGLIPREREALVAAGIECVRLLKMPGTPPPVQAALIERLQAVIQALRLHHPDETAAQNAIREFEQNLEEWRRGDRRDAFLGCGCITILVAIILWAGFMLFRWLVPG